MAVEFDPTTKRIIVQLGTDVLDLQDMYSRWVDWFLTGDNSKYLPALRYIGGDPTAPGHEAPFYFYMVNGWKVDACCEFEGVTHSLDIVGALLTDDESSPYWMDPEMPMTMIRGIVPILADTMLISGEGGGDAPSAAENANAVWSKALPGAFGNGTAGKIVGDNIDAKVSEVPTAQQIATEVATPSVQDISTGVALVLDVPTVQEIAAGIDVPTVSEITAGVLDTPDSVEPGVQVANALRLILAVLLGNVATQTELSSQIKTFRDINDTKDRARGTITEEARTVEILDKD